MPLGVPPIVETAAPDSAPVVAGFVAVFKEALAPEKDAEVTPET